MKHLALLTAAIALGLTLVTTDVEAAKRLGGGKSSGMQRQEMGQTSKNSTTPVSPAQTPATATSAKTVQSAAPAATQPKRSWMGPVAGLAAGLGLAALASHFGFGEELASFMLLGLVAFAVLFVIGFVMRKRGHANSFALATSAAGNSSTISKTSTHAKAAATVNPEPFAGSHVTSNAWPQDFDADAFARNAKVNFIRLQAANDSRNLEDLRECTTAELLAEIKADWLEEGKAQQKVDVISLNAEVLDVSEENSRFIVSVRFTGLVREGSHTNPVPIDEIWHLTQSRSGNTGWIVAGIQQTD